MFKPTALASPLFFFPSVCGIYWLPKFGGSSEVMPTPTQFTHGAHLIFPLQPLLFTVESSLHKSFHMWKNIAAAIKTRIKKQHWNLSHHDFIQVAKGNMHATNSAIIGTESARNVPIHKPETAKKNLLLSPSPPLLPGHCSPFVIQRMSRGMESWPVHISPMERQFWPSFWTLVDGSNELREIPLHYRAVPHRILWTIPKTRHRTFWWRTHLSSNEIEAI